MNFPLRTVLLAGALGGAAMLVAPGTRADAPEPTRTLTIREALDYAHAHQPVIRAALARVAARREDARVPGAQWLPTVGVSAEIVAATTNNTTSTYVPSPFVDLARIGATPATATGSLSPHASTLVGVGLTQELFDFGRIGAERAAADATVTVEGHRAEAERLDVDFGVEEAFFAVLAARAVVEASDEAYERSRVHRDLAKRGVDAGLRSPIDRTRAEAELDRFDVGRVRARGALAIAEGVLSAAIGAPDATVEVAGEAPDLADMPALGEALRSAQEHDPRLAEAIAGLKAAEARARSIAADDRPNLVLTASLTGRAGGAAPSSGVAANDDGWLPNVPNWDAGLVFAWPLVDAPTAARARAARATEDVQREAIELARERTIADVRRTYLQVGVALDAVSALRNEVVAARANYAQADARFGSGVGNAVELADAEGVRTDAEIQLALGQFEVARARAQFGRVVAEAP